MNNSIALRKKIAINDNILIEKKNKIICELFKKRFQNLLHIHENNRK
jgi:hypothetical protein